MQGAGVYVHIRYGAFVALDIFGGTNMRIVHVIRLFSACYRLAGFSGLIACAKYLCGALTLDDFTSDSSDFALGGYDG